MATRTHSIRYAIWSIVHKQVKIILLRFLGKFPQKLKFSLKKIVKNYSILLRMCFMQTIIMVVRKYLLMQTIIMVVRKYLLVQTIIMVVRIFTYANNYNGGKKVFTCARWSWKIRDVIWQKVSLASPVNTDFCLVLQARLLQARLFYLTAMRGKRVWTTAFTRFVPVECNHDIIQGN